MRFISKSRCIDADGVLHIQFRCGDGHERHDDVAFLDVILDPLPVDCDVSFYKMEAGIPEGFSQTVVGKVHAVYAPIRLIKDPLGQMVADETVYPQDQNLHDKIIPSLFLKY